jgi:hypothetical protein
MTIGFVLLFAAGGGDPRLGLLRPAFFQAHAGAATVLVDELDR